MVRLSLLLSLLTLSFGACSIKEAEQPKANDLTNQMDRLVAMDMWFAEPALSNPKQMETAFAIENIDPSRRTLVAITFYPIFNEADLNIANSLQSLNDLPKTGSLTFPAREAGEVDGSTIFVEVKPGETVEVRMRLNPIVGKEGQIIDLLATEQYPIGYYFNTDNLQWK
jgi:hypothetical protein